MTTTERLDAIDRRQRELIDAQTAQLEEAAGHVERLVADKVTLLAWSTAFTLAVSDMAATIRDPEQRQGFTDRLAAWLAANPCQVSEPTP